MRESVAGRVAVVTGGAGDIGSAIAAALVSDGFRVWILDIKPESEGEALASRLRGSGGEVHYRLVNQADRERVAQVLAELPRLDLIVISGATVQAQTFLEIDHEAWCRQIDINLTSNFVCAQEAARLMAAQGVAGQILFVSSWVASRPWPEIAAYSVSKAGIDQLMRQIALELAPQGIRANAVAPGIVRAGLAKGQLENEPAYAARVAEAIPLGELQSAEDIAQAVSFMASPGAATMTGTVLTVDGGCSLGQVR